MIVLDTDVVSSLLRSNASSALVERLSEIPPQRQSTTAITVGEIAYGAHRVGRPELLARALDLLSGARILSFDVDAAEVYGRVRSMLERSGTKLADPDLRIASIVLVHSATLITGNTRHFARIPDLMLENWLQS